MEGSNETSTRRLLKILLIRIFSSRYFIVIFDLLMSILISVHIAVAGNVNLPDKKLIIYALLQIAVNILCISAGYIDRKEKKFIYSIKEAYNLHNKINFEMAGRLYEANEIITNTIKNMMIKKDSINLLINFQKLSQSICDEIYNYLKTSYNYDEFEISIFQRFARGEQNFATMIAYKNNNQISSTLNREFDLNKEKQYVFSKIFSDNDTKIKILPDKKSVTSEFDWIESSKNREQTICQYIGVPIKTKRNKVEILLQIDVSMEKLLGKNEIELTQFTEFIIRPFANLLYCSYERDLIFNKFYDILEENLPKEEENNG